MIEGEKLKVGGAYEGSLAEHSLERDIGRIALNQTPKTEQAKDTPGVQNLKPGMNNKGEQAQAQAHSFIRRHGQSLNLFSRDSSLVFKCSGDETFSFDAGSFTINVPLSWFANKRFSEDQLLFANYHERAHFMDMRKNPEAFIKNFEQMEKDANTLAREYCRTHEGVSLEAVKRFYYGELHRLYNCLDDVYVNRIVTNAVPYFNGVNGEKEISELYQKLGFGDPNLTKIPLHRQMPEAILRDAMLGREYGLSEIDDRVKTALSTQIMGRSLRTLVNQNLNPEFGILVDPAERYNIIRCFVQPKYVELLDVALKEAESKKNKPSSGNRDSDGRFDPFNDGGASAGMDDILDTRGNKDEVARQVLDKFKEADKMKKMSPQERENYQARQRRDKFDEDHGITPRQRAENERVKHEIEGARKKMREFWQQLIGKSIEYRNSVRQHQPKGHLNIDDFIDRYPEIIEASQKGSLRNLEVYDRFGLERILVEQPERIEVTLLVDCSGSMNSDRIQAAKRAVALLLYSLKDFNDELEKTRDQTHTKLRADTQVVVFGSSFSEIKPFETGKKGMNRGREGGEGDADIIKSISAVQDDLGMTDDASPMRWLQSKLTDEEKSRIENGKLRKILFEITDGEPDNPSATKTNIQTLAEEGITMVGFQIYNIDEEKQKKFMDIWSEPSGNMLGGVKGIYVGDDIATLPDKLMRELSDMLRDIVI